MSDGEKKGMVSEWNQQIAFDSVFHAISLECRTAQQNHDVETWFNRVESLFVHCYPVFASDEVKHLKKKLDGVRRRFNDLQVAIQNRRPTGQKVGKLYIELFQFELDFREQFNKHNPLLLTKPKEDIQEF